MPFGRDTHVVRSNIVLDRGPGPQGKIWGWNSQFAAMLPIAKLLWPLFHFSFLFCYLLFTMSKNFLNLLYIRRRGREQLKTNDNCRLDRTTRQSRIHCH